MSRHYKVILKFTYKCKEPRLARGTLKINKVRSLILPRFKTCYKAIVTRKTWYWQKDHHELMDRTESPEVNPCIYGQLISTRRGYQDNSMGGKMMLVIHMQKNRFRCSLNINTKITQDGQWDLRIKTMKNKIQSKKSI